MNKKNYFKVLVGFAALAFTLSLNIRHAMNDYGILDCNLSSLVLAQSGSGSSSGSGSQNIYHKPVKDNCYITITGTIKIPWIKFQGQTHYLSIGGKVKLEAKDAQVDCQEGGNWACTYTTCTDFWSSAITYPPDDE